MAEKKDRELVLHDRRVERLRARRDHLRGIGTSNLNTIVAGGSEAGNKLKKAIPRVIARGIYICEDAGLPPENGKWYPVKQWVREMTGSFPSEFLNNFIDTLKRITINYFKLMYQKKNSLFLIELTALTEGQKSDVLNRIRHQPDPPIPDFTPKELDALLSQPPPSLGHQIWSLFLDAWTIEPEIPVDEPAREFPVSVDEPEPEHPTFELQQRVIADTERRILGFRKSFPQGVYYMFNDRKLNCTDLDRRGHSFKMDCVLDDPAQWGEAGADLWKPTEPLVIDGDIITWKNNKGTFIGKWNYVENSIEWSRPPESNERDWHRKWFFGRPEGPLVLVQAVPVSYDPDAPEQILDVIRDEEIPGGSKKKKAKTRKYKKKIKSTKRSKKTFKQRIKKSHKRRVKKTKSKKLSKRKKHK